MTQTTQDHVLNPDLQDRSSLAILWLAVASVGLVAFFWDGLLSLGQAWARPEYSYGPMVPLITAYMTLREIHHNPVVLNQDTRMPGLLMVLAGMLIGLFGNLSHIPDIITYGFIVAIGGLILILAGFRQGLRFWPGWLHLFFMLPLPNFIYWHLSTDLQFISSRLGVDFITMLGIPVYLDGNIIDLGVYKLQVAEACNGLRYLFPLLSFGWLFAVLYNGPNWHRAVLFLSTIPITIVMNSFRIGVIGALVHHYGIEQAEGFLHYFEGWVIFITCILFLFVEAWLLRLLVTRQERSVRILDIDFEGIMGPLSKAHKIPAGRALIGACTLLVLTGVLWQVSPSRAAVKIDREAFNSFPMRIGDWKGRANVLEPTIERVLGADDYLLASYASSSGQQLNLFVSFYKSQTSGSGIHSPEVCIPGGGWEVSGWQQAQIPIKGAKSSQFSVNRAIIQRGIERQLVYYWFEQRGRRLTNDFSAKFHTVWDSMRRGRSDGAMVRLTTPISHTDTIANAEKRLQAFIQKALPIMSKYIPS